MSAILDEDYSPFDLSYEDYMLLFSNSSYGEQNSSMWNSFDNGADVFDMDMDHLINNIASFVDADNIKSTTPMTYAIIVLYSASFLCGLTGNVTALCVVFKWCRISSPTTLLLISLLFSNLMTVAICLPFTMLSHVHGEWIHGKVSCKLLPFLQGASVFSGIFVLFALTFQQFCGEYYPHKVGKLFSVYGTRVIVMLIWAVAFLIPSPLLYVNELKIHELMGIMTVSMCNEIWPHQYSRHMYNITIFMLTYIIPHISFLGGYFKMILGGNRPNINDPRNEQLSSQNTIEQLINPAGRKNAQQLLAWLIGMFALLWLPYHVIIIYLDIHVEDRDVASLGTYVFPVAQWLALSTAAFHPICYCLVASDYRKLLLHFCLCKTDADTQTYPKGLFLQSCRQHGAETGVLEGFVMDSRSNRKEVMDVETVV